MSLTAPSSWSWGTTRLMSPNVPSGSPVSGRPASPSRAAPCAAGSGEDGLDHHRQIPTLISDGPKVRCRGDKKVARAGQAQSAAKRVAVDAADNWFSQARHQCETARRKVPAAMTLEVRHASVKAAQVGPGTEALSPAPVSTMTGPRARVTPAKRRRQVAQHHAGQRMRCRPVEGDGGDAALDLPPTLLQGRNQSTCVIVGRGARNPKMGNQIRVATMNRRCLQTIHTHSFTKNVVQEAFITQDVGIYNGL